MSDIHDATSAFERQVAEVVRKATDDEDDTLDGHVVQQLATENFTEDRAPYKLTDSAWKRLGEGEQIRNDLPKLSNVNHSRVAELVALLARERA